MARNESDREDLWAEAISLTSRAELRIPEWTDLVLIGQKPNGWWSVYIGQDIVLQFTGDGRLRRAFCEGRLFRTQGKTLARLVRERTSTETHLVRQDLDSAELAQFRDWMRSQLERLIDGLRSPGLIVERMTGSENNFEHQLSASCFVQQATGWVQAALSQDEWLADAIRRRP